ncbi:MAG: FecR family protein [Sphingobacteriaceae bacterium]
MTDEESIIAFLNKFSDNQHTEQEHAWFINWTRTAPIEHVEQLLKVYQEIAGNRADKELVSYPQLTEKIENSLNELKEDQIPTQYVLKIWPLFRKIASVAAIFFVIAGVGAYIWINREVKKPAIVKNKIRIITNEVVPGGNKAYLTLSNGEKIVLDSAQNGVVAIQAGTNIRKTAEGRIVYDAAKSSDKSAELSYNIITTPRGGQYQLTLPDGSQVWLNAASSLKFPASFSGKERIVEVTGEAYFEVAKVISASGVRVPFKVISANQLIEVLGTHFNVNAYPDEVTSNTTLLEGSVKIWQRTTQQAQYLKPGQQARVGKDIQVSNVDVNGAVAWKKGYFNFSQENIGSIMRKISRWYNVDIIYKGNITGENFIGSISKFEEVTQVLDMLQLTGSVHFKIENTPGKELTGGRRIVVMP